MGLSVYTKNQKGNVGGNALRAWHQHFMWQGARANWTAGGCNSQQICGGSGGLSTSSANRSFLHLSHGQRRPQSTATTGTTSFHGTSISVFHYSPKVDKGKEHRQLKFGEKKVNTVPELPDTFTDIWPTVFTKKKPSPPQSGMAHPDTSLLRPQLAMEYECLEKVTATDGTVDVTWSAHYPSQNRGKPFKVSITSLLPICCKISPTRLLQSSMWRT